jgi:hypothetical protein
MSFNDPFFTDLDWFKKKERNFLITGILILLVNVFIFFIIFQAVSKAGIKIEQTGGLGNNIGRFIQDIKNPEPLKE